MDYAGFPSAIGGATSSGYINNLESTDNGIILTPNPLGGQNTSGTISLEVDLKTSGQNFALGNDNWVTSPITTGDNNIAVGNNLMYDIVGNENVALGFANLRVINGGSSSNIVAVGARVMENINGSHFNNIGIGHDIISTNFSGDSNVVLGSNSLNTDSLNATNVILLGNNSMGATILSTNDTVIGSNNLQNMTETNLNKIVGYNNITNGTGSALNNHVIGNGCLLSQASPTSNIIIGSNILTVGNTANSNIIVGNNAGSDGNVVLDSTMLGNNNGNVTGDMVGALLVGTNIQMSSPTSPYTSVIAGVNTIVPSGNLEATTLIQGQVVGLGNATLNPRYEVESENKIALRSNGNFRSLKNVSWNYSNIFAFSVNDNTSVFASIDLENDIKWEPDIQSSASNKSVMLTLEFSCMQLSDNGTFYGTAGGSVSFMIHKNGGNWIFPDNSTSYSLLSNAQTRGTYSFMAGGGNINAVQVSQSSFGNPNIIFWLKYGSLAQCPTGTWLGYGTVSTQIRAQCSTNLAV